MALRETINKIFFDTSAIYAYINSKDPHHSAVSGVVRTRHGGLVITNYIFDEIITLARVRLGHKTALVVGNILLNAPEIERVFINESDESEAWRLFACRYDKEYSFTDCTSFVIMKRMNLTTAIALDEHFRQEGFEIVLQKETL